MRQVLDQQQPWQPPKRRRTPTRPHPRQKTAGTLANPFQRSDGVDLVRVSFRASVDCASALEQKVAALKMEGVARNEWLEELVLHGIKTGFRPKKRRDVPPDDEPNEREAG